MHRMEFHFTLKTICIRYGWTWRATFVRVRYVRVRPCHANHLNRPQSLLLVFRNDNMQSTSIGYLIRSKWWKGRDADHGVYRVSLVILLMSVVGISRYRWMRLTFAPNEMSKYWLNDSAAHSNSIRRLRFTQMQFLPIARCRFNSSWQWPSSVNTNYDWSETKIRSGWDLFFFNLHLFRLSSFLIDAIPFREMLLLLWRWPVH